MDTHFNASPMKPLACNWICYRKKLCLCEVTKYYNTESKELCGLSHNAFYILTVNKGITGYLILVTGNVNRQALSANLKRAILFRKK